MEIITFTARHVLYFTRLMKIHASKCLKQFENIKTMTSDRMKLLENDRNDYELRLLNHTFSDFCLNICVTYEYEDAEDEDNSEIDTSSLKIEVKMKHGKIVVKDTYGQNMDDLTKIIEWITSVQGEYKTCTECDYGLGVEDGFCENCYPAVCSQTDNCCVCLENEGVWVELDTCNHKLHRKCWEKTVGTKCPMCRAQTRSIYSKYQSVI